MKRNASAKTRILLALYETGFVPNTDMKVAFWNYNYSTLRRKVRELVDDGLVQEVRIPSHKKQYLTITQEGIAYLGKMFKTDLVDKNRPIPYSPERAVKQDIKKRYKQYARAGETITFLMAAGVLTLQREKPRLDYLASHMLKHGPIQPESDPWAGHRPAIADESDLVSLLRQGVYYSAAEVKAYGRLLGATTNASTDGQELMARSRFVGVVLKDDEMYVLHNTRNNLMMWYELSEKRTEEVLRRMFCKFPGYAHHDTHNEDGRLPAIVFGETMASLPALVTGHKFGIDKSVKHNQYPRTYRQINSSTDVYRNMYFVPTEKIGREILVDTLDGNWWKQHERTKKIIKDLDSRFFLREDLMNVYARHNDGYFFLYLNVLDLKFIAQVRNDGNLEDVYVAVHPECVNGVSKSLGIKMIGAMDVNPNEAGEYQALDFKRYLDSGHVNTGDEEGIDREGDEMI